MSPWSYLERVIILYRITFVSAALVLSAATGCNIAHREVALPGDSILEREQLIVHSDFFIPKKHRLIDELTARRADISGQLKLPVSDEPINIFIFEDADQYHQFMKREHAEFPNRRAFFVKNDTTLKVYAWWGDQVGDDLRHEVTHGYLHSVIPNLPLWLDEGLAEYYETPRGTHGLNTSHVFLLNDAFRRNEWEPSLADLEKLEEPTEMTQLHYAEAWLWVHFLLENENGNPKLLQDQLARLRMSAESEPTSRFVDIAIDDSNLKLIQHLKDLAEEL